MKTECEKVLLPKSVQQELEKLRAQAIADAAEIARLQSGFDDLKRWVEIQIKTGSVDDFDNGCISACQVIVDKINRITGADK